MMSHLLQMRGLKPKWYKWQCSNTQVASFTDAWIETKCSFLDNERIWSHLLQMRGLKHSGFRIVATSQSRIFYRCVD